MVYRQTKKVWESLGIPDLTGKQVLVKPNILVDALPEKAVTTHPYLVEAVCRIISERGGSPMVGDSPGLQKTGFSPTRCGIAQVCERLDIPWVDFTAKTTTTVKNPAAVCQQRFTVASAAVEADYIVNLPKMKTHQLMYTTGAVKNLFGLIPGISKSSFHLRYPNRDKFADMLLDLCETIPTEIHIMDAVIAMEGPGPGNGSPKSIGAIIAAKDPLALDLCVSYLMHESPPRIPILAHGYQRGLLSTLDHTKLEYIIDKPELYRPESFRRIERSGIIPSLFTKVRSFLKPSSPGNDSPFPKISSEKCILCKACIEICPADALSLQMVPDTQEQRVIVDRASCIRCYCCHEVCPVHAVTIEKNP